MLREMNAHAPDDAPDTLPSPDARPDAAGSAPLAAFSGEPGAFAEDAVHAYFGPATTTLAVGGFRAVFEAVVARRAAAGFDVEPGEFPAGTGSKRASDGRQL